MDFRMVSGVISIIGMLAVAGIALLIWCFRGKRIDDHPVCRRCDFDLTGLPKESTRCPECGSELSHTRAIRIGHRRKRPLIGLAGLILLAGPSATTSKFLYPILTDPNPDQYKPYWWLMAEARHFGQAGQNASAKELLSRLKANLLTADQERQTADFVLERQADVQQSWNTLWGDFIQQARGGLSSAQWDRYVQNLVADTPELQVRPCVARGDPFAARVVYSAARGGSGGAWTALVESRLFIDGNEVRHASRLLNDSPDASDQQSLTVTADPLGQYEGGRHTASAIVSIKSRETDAPAREIRLSKPFELLKPGTPSVTLRPDPAAALKVRDTIRIRNVQATKQGTLLMWIDSYSLPVNVAFSVIVRSDVDADISMGTFSRAAHGGSFLISLAGKPPRSLRADHVQVLLLPSVAAAAQTVDLTEIWDGQIVYDDIPVIRP